MRILIASGIYPPDIGGPAQYARNLFETWKRQGHQVKVAAFRWERAAPPGLRHILYMNKVMRKGWNADLILVLDTWSAAVPTMLACRMMGKRYIIRTGGDFLWETYVERTGDLVPFKDFCDTKMDKLSGKERLIFKWGGAALRKAAAVIFSTDWQMGIFEKAYGLDHKKSFLVENFCGPREASVPPDNRMFVAGTRPLKWKNAELLKEAFADARATIGRRGLSDVELDCGKAVYDSFVEKIRHSYAVILASLGDISPNLIFDAIRVGTPFILTKETGIADRVRECAIFVDPQDPKDIADKIVWLSDPANRAAQAEKVRRFAFIHTWEEIGSEIVGVWKRVGKERRRDKKAKKDDGTADN
jgi:glycosyltransferase involved in cell wall biosynthesis